MKKLILIASACALLAACGGGASLPDPAATPFPTPPEELMRAPKELKTLETNAPGTTIPRTR
jgi:hypothetical protein